MKVITLAMMALFSLPSFGSTHTSPSFIPEDIVVPESSLKSDTSIPSEIMEVAAKAEAIFEEEVSAQGGELSIEFQMEVNGVNAYAARRNGVWLVNFYGGLIRHRLMDADVFTVILCHELGHHLGGDPIKYPGQSGKDWSSAEGQSDYFATNICAKKIFQDSDNWDYISQNQLSETASKACRLNHSQAQPLSVCLRSSIIAEKTARFLKDIGGRRTQRKPTPKIDRPSRQVVSSTNRGYPSNQCRLDTLFQGALCTKIYDFPYETDMNCGGSGEFSGARPACWFKEI